MKLVISASKVNMESYLNKRCGFVWCKSNVSYITLCEGKSIIYIVSTMSIVQPFHKVSPRIWWAFKFECIKYTCNELRDRLQYLGVGGDKCSYVTCPLLRNLMGKREKREFIAYERTSHPSNVKTSKHFLYTRRKLVHGLQPSIAN